MKHKKSCSNCIKGTSIAVNSDILCRIKGVVSPDYICSKYRSAPCVTPIKDISNKCIECEFFIPAEGNSNTREGLGFCQLFTVRQYNGYEKNACSKFTKKSQREVS